MIWVWFGRIIDLQTVLRSH